MLPDWVAIANDAPSSQPCIVCATIFVSQFADDAAQAMICVGSLHLSRHRSDIGHASAHDEFNSGRKVSAINQASMITRHHLLGRLRRSAGLRVVGLCAIGLMAAAGAAAAEDASRWDGDARSAVRLIAGSSRHGDSAALRAGLEIRVKPGWHTYWRYPGDAGVPPRFDFAGSQNVKAVDVLWPAPQAIPEEGLTVIGYTDNVILPLAVVPQNRAKPVTLRLK